VLEEKLIDKVKSINGLDDQILNYNFQDKYKSYCKLTNNWESERPVVTTVSMPGCVTCLQLDKNTNELIASTVDGSASLIRLYSNTQNSDNNNKNLLMQQHHKQTKVCDKISTFQGHGGPIWCIDRYNDNVYTGSYDKTLKIWNSKSGNCLATMRAHTSWVSSLQYDSDYHLLISSSWDGTIKLWNPLTLQNVTTLTNSPGNFIYCARSNLKENEILASTHMRTIDIWDLEKKVLKNSLIGHTDRVSSLKINHDKVFSGSEDKNGRLWDKRSGKCEVLFQGHNRGVTQIEYDEINGRFFTASHDATVKVWDVRKNKEIRTLQEHSKSIYAITFDQTKLITGSQDNTIRIWNFACVI